MRTLLATASLLLAVFAGTAAHAHAFLDHASPLVGGTVAAAPHEVTLWFTQSLEPAFSRVEVSDSNGARVDQGKAQSAAAPCASGSSRLRQEPTASIGTCSRLTPTRRKEASPSVSAADRHLPRKARAGRTDWMTR